MDLPNDRALIEITPIKYRQPTTQQGCLAPWLPAPQMRISWNN